MISTPLLDFFRRGEVAHDIRLLAARGALAPRALEQLGLLILLSGDADPEISGAAEATLASLPRESVAGFLARAEVPTDMRAFFAARGVEPAATAAVDTDEPLVDTSPDAGSHQAAEPQEPEDQKTAMLRIAALSVAQRISLAMKGTREERAILIRDPNKIVAVAVLSSPKLTETEVEAIAKMANVSDEILRIIGHTRAWVKNYTVVLALTKNPKTPVAMSMNFLPRLNEKDLRMLSMDRNVPEILRITARKKIVIDR
jgi:hypothetical protein